MKKVLLLLLALVSLSGCAHVISEGSRQLVDPELTFAKLRENPDAYIGKYALLGGLIATTKNSNDGGQVEVVQLPLNRDGIPEDTFESGGRFLATSPEFLDPLVYKSSRVLTLVGEVKGKKVQPLDGVDYSYPVLAIREVYLMKTPQSEKVAPYPLYGPYYNYSPYYYGYGSDPYWYRPLGPVWKQ
jgi:outer membrane lipoprotein